MGALWLSKSLVSARGADLLSIGYQKCLKSLHSSWVCMNMACALFPTIQFPMQMPNAHSATTILVEPVSKQTVRSISGVSFLVRRRSGNEDSITFGPITMQPLTLFFRCSHLKPRGVGFTTQHLFCTCTSELSQWGRASAACDRPASWPSGTGANNDGHADAGLHGQTQYLLVLRSSQCYISHKRGFRNCAAVDDSDGRYWLSEAMRAPARIRRLL